jgi:hypothetical protein
MDYVLGLLLRSFEQVLLSLVHNWPFLLASILIAAVLKLFLDARKVSAFLARHRGAGVGVATAAAVGTPLCSCGTTAVVLGMLASTMPWGPIVAFMVASPLSSPEGMVYTAGLFGWPFAVAMFAASIALGLTGGAVATVLEKRGLLRGQARFATAPRPKVVPIPLGADVTARPTCGCSAAQPAPKSKLAQLPRELLTTGGRLLAMFVGFAFIGVPLAATIGLPLYLSSEASLPMVRALLDSGMSQGAVMAFLIAGSGTSIGAIAGALTIARWRVVGLVVGLLWIGAMAAGFAWNFLLALGLGA